MLEQIPNEDSLYYRVHKSFVIEGKIIPGVFKERGDGDSKGMSTDWAKYSTAKEALSRSKVPNDNGILQAIVGEIRSVGLAVEHAPLPDNYSHTNVKGLDADSTELRRKLLKIFSSWAIEISKIGE